MNDRVIIWKKTPNIQQYTAFLIANLDKKIEAKLFKTSFKKPKIIIQSSVHPQDKDVSKVYFSKKYYEIKDRIERSVIKPHSLCLEYVLKNLACMYVEAIYNERLGCPLTHAYLMWQVYWEGIQSISGLPYQSRDIQWGPSFPLGEQVAKRLFALDCIESFWFLLDIAEQMDRENVFVLLFSLYTEDHDPGLVNWAVTQKIRLGVLQEKVFLWKRQKLHKQTEPFSQKHLEEVKQACNRMAASLRKDRWSTRNLS
jgi:hypothetical protein